MSKATSSLRSCGERKGKTMAEMATVRKKNPTPYFQGCHDYRLLRVHLPTSPSTAAASNQHGMDVKGIGPQATRVEMSHTSFNYSSTGVCVCTALVREGNLIFPVSK